MCTGTALLYEIAESRQAITFKVAESIFRKRGVTVDVLDGLECIAQIERRIAERPKL